VTAPAPIRVLIADNHALIRSGLAGMLGVHADIDVIGSVEDGAAAIRTAAQLRPDVVVMDIRMPKTNGIEATREIRRQPDAPRVLVLTTFDLDEYVYGALLGARPG
jgi:DNA-binding NarL/FixJ family response regulator